MGHQLLEALAVIDTHLKGLRDVNPVFMTTTDKATTLLEVPRLVSLLSELQLRVMACAGDVADADGARDVADWVAHRARTHRGTSRADLRLAKALDTERPVLRDAVVDGRVNVAQAHVIAKALAELPADLDPHLVAQAEVVLIQHAAEFGPEQLRKLGAKILDVVAPEIAEAEEAKKLADLERSARARQRLMLKSLGDGTVRISGLLTEQCAHRLATYLNAYTSPRRNHLEQVACPECGTTHHQGQPCSVAFGDPGPAPIPLAEVARRRDNSLSGLDRPRANAEALNALLEGLDPNRLPLHGGDSTTVIVTISLESLRNELGTATIATPRGDDGHTTITAAEARRLACQAKIIPAVLGGASMPLDLGRSRRLYSPYQRKAIGLMHTTCIVEGCPVPAAWCEIHHLKPWSRGGRTDLADGVPACGRHHHLFHDHAYHHERLASGAVRFHRRT